MTDTILHQEYVLRGPSAWQALCAFVRDHAKAANDAGAPLRVILTTEEQDRLDEQIAYYFGVVVKTTAEQAWVGGRQYSKDVWHEHFAQQFLPAEEIELPTGQRILRRASIAKGKIGVKAMAHFTKEVEAYVTQELGVRLPAPREVAR